MKSTHLLLAPIALLLLIAACRQPKSSKYETRAVWMSRFDYAQNKSSNESKEYIRSNFESFKKAGLNTIIFQVRGTADALYKSKYEPWSALLSDSLGLDPGWDPLEFALNHAHDLGLELHAWVNTFPAWRANDPPPGDSDPPHPLRLHPDWIVCDSAGVPMHPEHGYITFSPGIPAVQEHIQRVVLDIVHQYDVDGIHFDYIRYPESTRAMGYSHDSVSIRRFNSVHDNPGKYSWEDFQREQVNHFVENIYNKIDSLKPWIKVSAAVIGHHFGAGWNGYHAVYQDARRWMAIGKIDIIFPMTYQKIGHPTAPFDGALDEWQQMTHLGRHIIPGVATYRVGTQFTWSDIWDQIELIRRHNFPGMVFFSSSTLPKGLEKLNKTYYLHPALIAPLPWKNRVPLLTITDFSLTARADSLILNWRCEGAAQSFVLYSRLPETDPEHILAIIPGKSRTYSSIAENSRTYYLTVVNRAGMESRPVEVTTMSVADARIF